MLRNYVHRTLIKVFDEPGRCREKERTIDKRKYLPTKL